MPERYMFPPTSLEDFLISNPLNIDTYLDDGGGCLYSVKGIEIDATILFADISFFSARTKELNPTETLIFVNNFFSWITYKASSKNFGIIDKYIGDEIMIIFSKSFGSKDPFEDALTTAKNMFRFDPHSFKPHIGIASGEITIGYVGTPKKYNASAFGYPVTLASRCASVKSKHKICGGSIFFPKNEWRERNFENIFQPEEYSGHNNEIVKEQNWNFDEHNKVELKNIEKLDIIEVSKKSINVPMLDATNRAKLALKQLKEHNVYKGKY